MPFYGFRVPTKPPRRRPPLTIDCASVQVQIGTMNLLLNQVRKELAELAQRKGLKGARVEYKVNKSGALVIALILPETFPGEWTAR